MSEAVDEKEATGSQSQKRLVLANHWHAACGFCGHPAVRHRGSCLRDIKQSWDCGDCADRQLALDRYWDCAPLALGTLKRQWMRLGPGAYGIWKRIKDTTGSTGDLPKWNRRPPARSNASASREAGPAKGETVSGSASGGAAGQRESVHLGGSAGGHEVHRTRCGGSVRAADAEVSRQVWHRGSICDSGAKPSLEFARVRSDCADMTTGFDAKRWRVAHLQLPSQGS